MERSHVVTVTIRPISVDDWARSRMMGEER
jgi:hypothetical protein